MLNLTIYFAFFAMLLFAKAAFDRWLIVENKVSPRHGREITLIAVLCAVMAYILFGLQPVTIGVIALSSALWWLLFDISLNLSRGLKWNYIGSTSTLDKFLRIEPKWQYHFKGLALVIAIVILVITINL